MTQKALDRLQEEPEHFVDLGEYHSWRRRLIFAVFVGTLCGVPTTYLGLAEATGSILLAVLMTTVSVAVALTVVGWLMDIYPRVRSWIARIWILLVIGGPGGLIIVSTSTTWSGAMVAAPAAQRIDLEEKVAFAEADVAELGRRRLAEADLTSVLEAKAIEFDELKRREDEHGGTSGIRSSRPGKTSNDLAAIAGSYRLAAGMARDDQVRLAGAMEEAREALRTMREVTRTAKASRASMAKALAEFADARLGLEQAVGELGRSVLDDGSLLGPIDGAIRQQQATDADARGERRRKKQQTAKESVATMAKGARDSAAKALADARSGPYEPHGYGIAGPLEAIAAHWRDVGFLCAPALAADILLPFVALLILGFLHSRLEEAPDPDTPLAPSADVPSIPAPSPKDPFYDRQSHRSPARLAMLHEARDRGNLHRDR